MHQQQIHFHAMDGTDFIKVFDALWEAIANLQVGAGVFSKIRIFCWGSFHMVLWDCTKSKVQCKMKNIEN